MRQGAVEEIADIWDFGLIFKHFKSDYFLPQNSPCSILGVSPRIVF